MHITMSKSPCWNWVPSELKLPQVLGLERVRALHASIEKEWDNPERSACQTAAGRALWKHVIHDPLAELLAGESYLTSLYHKMTQDCLNNTREVPGVILAIRTLWFDAKIQAALASFHDTQPQIVILGAGMDARAYRLSCLKDSTVFEVDLPNLIQMKAALLEEAAATSITTCTEDEGEQQNPPTVMAKSLIRVAADIRDNEWVETLQKYGFVPKKNTVWVLEGILYYLSDLHAMQVLRSIAAHSALTHTVLLADFMNESSTTLARSTFHFYSDWPDHLLPSLGFSHVQLSQIGDPDAHFGLMDDPLNLFNKLRQLPRSVQTHPDDGTPCRRLYLVQASASPNQITPS